MDAIRAFMHLDTVFTMIDRDKFTIHPEIRDRGGKMNCFVLEKVEGQPFPRITHETDLEHVLRVALEVPNVWFSDIMSWKAEKQLLIGLALIKCI